MGEPEGGADVGRLLAAHLPAVRPGCHMNKQHWITVILDGSTDEEVLPLIADSWALTAPKGRLKREGTAEGPPVYNRESISRGELLPGGGGGDR